mgnify:FL=1
MDSLKKVLRKFPGQHKGYNVYCITAAARQVEQATGKRFDGIDLKSGDIRYRLNDCGITVWEDNKEGDK